MTPVAPPAVAREYHAIPVVAAGFGDPAGVQNYHAILNEYGRPGWELAGVTSYPGRAIRGRVAVLHFERPVG